MSTHAQSLALSPAPDAAAIASTMQQSTPILRQILEETVASAEQGQLLESGRTFCGQQVLAPLQRNPLSVSLPVCEGATGIVHSHVTTEELANSTHSLPDWANVVWGAAQASMVIGTETSEVIVEADSQPAMQEAFQNAVGLELSGPQDVVTALQRGYIRDPPATRERVRRQLSPLVSRAPTSFPEFDARLGTIAPPGDTTPQPGVNIPDDAPDIAGLRRQARIAGTPLHNAFASVSLVDIAAGQVASEAVSRLLGALI